MNVLSLFDGIGSGRLALDKLNINIDKYYASEIDPVAIKIATANFPDIIEIGDVRNIYNINNVDLLIGGSPCTNLSTIGDMSGMTSTNNEKIVLLERYLELKNQGMEFHGESYLFWEYVRILKLVKPKYFLLENVYMKKEWQDIITKQLGVEPIIINSNLVSAQNRKRLYWTNIPNITIPKDRNILLDNILEKGNDFDDISYYKSIQNALPKLQNKFGYIPNKFNAYNLSKIINKSPTLTTGSSVTSSCAILIWSKNINGIHEVKNKILDQVYDINLPDGKYNLRKLTIKEMERLQTLPDNYTNIPGISVSNKSKAIGNGWTIDVITHIFKNL